MTLTTLRSIALGAAAAGLLVIAPASATAQPEEGPTASGLVGSAAGVAGGQPVDIQPLAPCTVGTSGGTTTNGATASNFVSFGPGTSTCGRDAATGAAKAEVTGKRFKLDGLRAHGGPVIKISSFAARCNTTGNGSQASIQLTGFSGIQIPNPIPRNHTVTIPGARPGDPVVARIVVNEVITPEPADGSITVNLMHVTLFPDGPNTGHVIVGSVSCSPDPDFAA